MGISRSKVLEDALGVLGENIERGVEDEALLGLQRGLTETARGAAQGGLVGGSLDLESQADAVAQLLASRREGRVAARAGQRQARRGLDAERRRLIQAVRGGVEAAPEAADVLSGQQDIISNTFAALPSRQLGGVFDLTAGTIEGVKADRRGKSAAADEGADDFFARLLAPADRSPIGRIT